MIAEELLIIDKNDLHIQILHTKTYSWHLELQYVLEINQIGTNYLTPHFNSLNI